jgi:hypothetical protein
MRRQCIGGSHLGCHACGAVVRRACGFVHIVHRYCGNRIRHHVSGDRKPSVGSCGGLSCLAGLGVVCLFVCGWLAGWVVDRESWSLAGWLVAGRPSLRYTALSWHQPLVQVAVGATGWLKIAELLRAKIVLGETETHENHLAASLSCTSPTQPILPFTRCAAVRACKRLGRWDAKHQSNLHHRCKVCVRATLDDIKAAYHQPSSRPSYPYANKRHSNIYTEP